MLTKSRYDNLISSPKFITSQLQFESQIYTRINQECVGHIVQEGSYQTCYRQLTRKIKKFALFTQMLVDKREDILRQTVEKECTTQAIGKVEDFLDCFTRVECRLLNDTLHKDEMYLDKLRNQLINS